MGQLNLQNQCFLRYINFRKMVHILVDKFSFLDFQWIPTVQQKAFDSEMFSKAHCWGPSIILVAVCLGPSLIAVTMSSFFRTKPNENMQIQRPFLLDLESLHNLPCDRTLGVGMSVLSRFGSQTWHFTRSVRNHKPDILNFMKSSFDL